MLELWDEIMMLADWQITLVSFCLSLLGVLVIHKLWHWLLTKLRQLTNKTQTIWDDVFLNAIETPVTVAIWLTALVVMVLGSSGFWTERQNGFLWSLSESSYIILLGWAVLRFISQTEQAVRKTPSSVKIDQSAIDLIGKLAYILVGISFALVVLQTMGVQITGLLAVGGAGSLVVGLAAKDLLSNLFGGAIIYLDRPFKVGDWILSPDKEIEGTVEKISWRMTRIRTFNKQLLYVPNSVFTTISIQNPSRMTNRRIKEIVGIRYQDVDRVNVILQDIEAMLRQHPEIDSNQTLMVVLVSFGASSLDCMIYTFTKTTEWIKFQHVKQDVMLKIAAIVHSHEADFAFPTSTIHVPDSLAVKQISNKEH